MNIVICFQQQLTKQRSFRYRQSTPDSTQHKKEPGAVQSLGRGSGNGEIPHLLAGAARIRRIICSASTTVAGQKIMWRAICDRSRWPDSLSTNEKQTDTPMVLPLWTQQRNVFDGNIPERIEAQFNLVRRVHLTVDLPSRTRSSEPMSRTTLTSLASQLPALS